MVEHGPPSAFDAIVDPILVVTPEGWVVHINRATAFKLPEIAIGSPVFEPGSEQSTSFLRYLGLCNQSSQPLPGILHLNHHGKMTRLACWASPFGAVGEPRTVAIHLRVEPEHRFEALTRTINDLRGELAARLRLQQALKDMLGERDQLLQRLQEDASAREKAERERDQVLARLYRVTIEERLRLARDLHDHAGQHLMSLRLGLTQLGPLIDDAKGRASWAQLLLQVDTAGRDLHRVAVALRPSALEEFGLPAALSSLVGEWSEATGIAGQFQTIGSPVIMAPESQVTVYRLVQEALTNIARHATSVADVKVCLQFTETHTVVTVEDDGCGFDWDVVTARGGDHFGLVGMRERVALVGGQVEVDSSPGRGTTILARIGIERTHHVG